MLSQPAAVNLGQQRMSEREVRESVLKHLSLEDIQRIKDASNGPHARTSVSESESSDRVLD